MDKFGRSYDLKVQLRDGTFLEIQPPLTIDFEIVRQLAGSVNYSQIRVYNLNEVNRGNIRKDYSDYGTDSRFISLRAGYGEVLYEIYSGCVDQAWSIREGTNYITTIQCFDGGYANTLGMIPDGQTFPKGGYVRDMLQTLMGAGYTPQENPYLPLTSFGAVGPSFTQNNNGLYQLSRQTVPTGNTIEWFKNNYPQCFFIDNGKSFLLANSECRQGIVAEINSDVGLLATPLRENTIVQFDMVFEPGLIPGQLLDLKSITNPFINGRYKINVLRHKGMISPAVCGKVITSIEFLFGGTPSTVVTDQ